MSFMPLLGRKEKIFINNSTATSTSPAFLPLELLSKGGIPFVKVVMNIPILLKWRLARGKIWAMYYLVRILSKIDTKY